MKFSKWIVATLIFSVITLNGCTSYSAIHLRQHQLKNQYSYYKIDPPLYSGDIVELENKDGNQYNFTVQRSTPHAIVSTSGQTIELAEITSLKRKDFSTGKTAALVAAGIGAPLVIFSIAYATLIAATIAHGMTALLLGWLA